MFNRRRKQNHQPLTALEQFVMDYVWAHPNCTAETCRAGLAAQRAMKDSTVLRKLEEKGYVMHKVEGRTFVYSATDTMRDVAVRAVQQLIDRFCGGSVDELVIGLVDNQILEPHKLKQLAEKIASRKDKKS
jgi:BlaI family transcriptional regulator, penicillinase repressor